MVRVETVRQMAERDTVVQTFPGVLTEKYVRHGQEWPMSVNELGLVHGDAQGRHPPARRGS